MNLAESTSPLRVAIIGSGPSGFYAAEALFKTGMSVTVDMFERLPTPFGLLRGGVAPDHQRMKSIASAYEKIAMNDGFHFFGNVCIGRDLTIEELRHYYDALIFACGTESDRKLGIPGEDLPGSHTATEFVGWYNGHPDYQSRQFDLSQKAVAIIGQGNVAIDVTRILAKSPSELMSSDITENALVALRNSNVEDIYLIGRRGAAQAAFTQLEIQEMGELDESEPVVPELELNDADRDEIAANNKARKNIEVLERFFNSSLSGKKKRVHVLFLKSPVAIEGNGRVERLVLEKNALSGEAGSQRAQGIGETETLNVGLVFRSIGYRGLPMPGVPFDPARGVFPNEGGRILDEGKPVCGMYVTGWIKRGPSGVIGTNRKDSIETVQTLIDDIPSLKPADKRDSDDLQSLLLERGVKVLTFSHWQTIDKLEREAGEKVGKPREKFTSLTDILSALHL
ncbi:MAG: FAD-dependent oxidoreductase [bacterium]|nr:FAD-dependent oxidoreductase [bacterium]